MYNLLNGILENSKKFSGRIQAEHLCMHSWSGMLHGWQIDRILHTTMTQHKDIFVQVEWIHIGMGLACDSGLSSLDAGNQAEKALLLIVAAIVDFHMGHPIVRAVRAAVPGEPLSSCLM